MPTATSRNAHATNCYEPKERLIIQTLRKVGPMNRRSIATLTGFETSCVAARVNHLVGIGVVEVCGSIRCAITGKITEVVRVNAQP